MTEGRQSKPIEAAGGDVAGGTLFPSARESLARLWKGCVSLYL